MSARIASTCATSATSAGPGGCAPRLLRDPVDILHAQSPYPAGIARLVVRSLPQAVRPRLVYTVHNTFHELLAADPHPERASPTRSTTWTSRCRARCTRRSGRGSRAGPRSWCTACCSTRCAAQLAHRDAVRAELGIGDRRDRRRARSPTSGRQKDYPNLLATRAGCCSTAGGPGRIVAVGQGPLEAEMRALHERLGPRRPGAAARPARRRGAGAGGVRRVHDGVGQRGPAGRAHGGARPRAPGRRDRGRRDPRSRDRTGSRGCWCRRADPEALADAIAAITGDDARARRDGRGRRDSRASASTSGVGRARIEQIYGELVPAAGRAPAPSRAAADGAGDPAR